MRIVEQNKTKTHKTNYTLLIIFCLLAFASKSYAVWYFGPETQASKWIYEKSFGITVSQKTSLDSELAAVSMVQGTHVEIKASNDGVLPAASGSLVYRKIQTPKIDTDYGAGASFIVSFKYTAVRKSETNDGIYPSNCYIDICYANADGTHVDHNFKAIESLATNDTKKSYTKSEGGKTYYYYIVTGTFKMKSLKDYLDTDAHIRIWPKSGVNFHKLLISDVEAYLEMNALAGSLPTNETDINKWVFPSGYAVTPEYVTTDISELPYRYSAFTNTGFAKPYIALRGLKNGGTPPTDGVLKSGIMTRTVTGLNPGDYNVSLRAVICRIGSSSTEPGNLFLYTGATYDSSTSECKTSLSSVTDKVSSTYYYNYTGWGDAKNISGAYMVATVTLPATVGDDGKLSLSVRISGSNYHFLAFKDFTVTAVSAGAGVYTEPCISPDAAPTTLPDDNPLITVSPTTNNKFIHSHGRVYDTNPRPSDFPSGDNKEWKTSADDPRLASGVKMQRTHEYVHDVYVMPGDQCELMPYSDFHTAHHNGDDWDNKYFDTYHRWYDYKTDKANGRLSFPFIYYIDENNHRDEYDDRNCVVVYGDGSGNAKGHFGGLRVNGKTRSASRAIYSAPLNYDAQGIFDVIAMDVACEKTGNGQTVSGDLNEPTLAYRHIFVIHSAQKMADDNFTATTGGITKEKPIELLCPEGTPFQYRLDNFEYRGAGTSAQKPTGFYYKKRSEEGGQSAFEYIPVYHYRVEIRKLTGKQDNGTELYDEVIGSTTILGAYNSSGTFYGDQLYKYNRLSDRTIRADEETICNDMEDNLVYTYKCINGYDRSIYWKKPTVGKYRIRICAVDIVQKNGSYVAEDLKVQNDYGSDKGAMVLQSYNLTVMPNKDANMVVEEQLNANDFAYIYQRPDEMVKEYGDPFDVVNFDLTNEEKQFMSNGDNVGYYKFPLAWDESAYGFGYENKLDYDMYVVANSSAADRVPYTRSGYTIYDRLYADTKGSKKGNFLYVNAASDPGHMAKINLGNDMCTNSRIYVSAWINEFNENSETANLVFTFRGISAATKQPEVISRYVTGYIPGGCNTTNGFVNKDPIGNGSIPTTSPDYRGKWMHVYYYFDPPSDIEAWNLESYEITLENNCTSSDGADYAIDDLRAFICKPNIKATQTKPICNGEASSNIELATDFDLLLKAYTQVVGFSEQFENVSKPTDLYYTIIDKEKYMAVYNKEHSTMSAFNASVVKGIYGATGDNDEYGKLKFYSYYDQNMNRTTATDEQKKQNTTRDASSGRRMLYFPDYIKSDGLKSNTPYWIVIGSYEYEVQQYYASPLNPCSNAREFTVTVGNVIKIDGQPTASRHGLNICSNQRPKISVDMTGVTSSGSPATGYTYDRFDWFVGNKAAFEAAKYNEVGLEESLAAFRDLSGHYTDDETALRNLSPTGSFTAGMKACLLHFIDEKKLSLYKTFEFPSTYDQFDEDPNGTSIALTIIPVDPYHNPDILFCLEPFDVEIPISTREPSMKNGDDSGVIQYTMDDVPLRIGLTQLKKCCTIDPTSDITKVTPSKYLIMPLRDVHVETTGVEALIEKSDDELIYLVDTNDPALSDTKVEDPISAFGAKLVNTFSGTSGLGEDKVLYIGKVSDIKADVWDKNDPTKNPGNKCHLAFFNNIKFREGYWYTIRFSYQEKYTSTVTKDQDVCPGDVLCTIKVVPEYQMWTGKENGNWNNDGNWRRVTKAELLNPTSISNDFITDGGTNNNTASFVPADFTKVIIPAEPTNPLILYGLRETDNKSAVTFAGGNGTSYFIKNMVKTTTGGEPIVGYTAAIDTASYKINFDMSSVDLTDGNVACRAWYDHTCDQIHFNSEAQMISQQYLHYNKAWADVEVVPGRWYTFTSPITNVVAGDFYLPTATGRQDTPLFEDITYKTSLNDRFKPAVYQRTWNAKDATLWHEDATSTQVGTALNWSHVYNETNVNYDTGKGSSIKVDVSAMPTAKQPSKVKFRFPKADTKYTYYKPGNELGQKDAEDVLSAAMVDGKRTYRVEDFTSSVEQVIGENTNGTYYLVGNPFMCELDLEKFFETNTQFQKKLWTLTEGSQRVVVMTGDAVITTSATNNALTQRYVQPFQSFFLALKETPTAGATIKAKFDATMMHVPEESSTTGNSKMRKNAAAPADGGLLRISTATADGIESAVVLADGVVRKTAGAETLFDSNLAEDVTVYSVIKGQAMTIAEVADVDTIPIGITRNDGETEINITGVASFGRPMWIADAETGEVRELDEDITLKQSGNGVRYYLLSRLASAGKPAISTPLLRTDNHTVSITAPAEAELTDLRIVTVGGMNVTNIANAGNEYTTELAEGIYIITLRCNNASYTYKVVIW